YPGRRRHRFRIPTLAPAQRPPRELLGSESGPGRSRGDHLVEATAVIGDVRKHSWISASLSFSTRPSLSSFWRHWRAFLGGGNGTRCTNCGPPTSFLPKIVATSTARCGVAW